MKKFFKGTAKEYSLFISLGIGVFIITLITPIKYPASSIFGYTPWYVFIVLLAFDIYRKKFARSLAYFVGMSLAYVLLIATFILGPVLSDHMNRQTFDADLWKNTELNTWKNPARLRMVGDLLKKHEMKGMTRKEVLELLGPPTDTTYFRSAGYKVYWLGPERGLYSIDSEWLGLKFENNIVTEVEMLRD